MRLGLGDNELLKILRICLGLAKGFLIVKKRTSWIPALLVELGLGVFVTLW